MMRRFTSWFLCIAIGLSVLATMAMPQGHARSVRARRVINNRDMWMFSLDSDCFWQSDHQLLYIRETKQPLPGMAGWEGGTYSQLEGWRLVDVTTGKQTELKELDNGKHFEDFDGEAGANASISPDGKWLLSWGWSGEADTGSIYSDLSMIDGSHHRRPHLVKYSDICWLDDSRHWIEWDDFSAREQYHRLLIHSVNDDTVRELHIPWRGGLNNVSMGSARFVSLDRFLTQVPMNDMVIDRDGFITIRELNLRDSGSVRRSFRIHVGKGVKVAEVRISAGGERAAVLLPAQHEKPWRILVSALDGTKLHDVAGLPRLVDDSDFLIDHLDWSPDGKRLSFHYDNAVWVVPAD